MDSGYFGCILPHCYCSLLMPVNGLKCASSSRFGQNISLHTDLIRSGPFKAMKWDCLGGQGNWKSHSSFLIRVLGSLVVNCSLVIKDRFHHFGLYCLTDDCCMIFHKVENLELLSCQNLLCSGHGLLLIMPFYFLPPFVRNVSLLGTNV